LFHEDPFIKTMSGGRAVRGSGQQSFQKSKSPA
jgi:hypothetical protein